RLINFRIPAGNSFRRYTGIVFADLCLPRVLSLAIWFVTSHDCPFNGGCRKGNAVAFRLQICRWDSEFHPVKPKIPVLAVSFLCPETDCHRSASVLAGGNQHLVVVKRGSR